MDAAIVEYQQFLTARAAEAAQLKSKRDALQVQSAELDAQITKVRYRHLLHVARTASLQCSGMREEARQRALQLSFSTISKLTSSIEEDAAVVELMSYFMEDTAALHMKSLTELDAGVQRDARSLTHFEEHMQEERRTRTAAEAEMAAATSLITEAEANAASVQHTALQYESSASAVKAQCTQLTSRSADVVKAIAALDVKIAELQAQLKKITTETMEAQAAAESARTEEAALVDACRRLEAQLH